MILDQKEGLPAGWGGSPGIPSDSSLVASSHDDVNFLLAKDPGNISVTSKMLASKSSKMPYKSYDKNHTVFKDNLLKSE